MKQIEHSTFTHDLRDEYLLNRLRIVWTSKEIDKRSLAEVLETNSLREGLNYQDVIHMNSFSVDDYYSFFKSGKSDGLYFDVRKCLDCGNHNDTEGIDKSVGEKAKAALIRIASESRINRMRVSTLYNINIEQ